ncbi:MAG TPA: F0F1 ATP synthase subunit A [Candidatus Dormibacteraeota bacterium]
MLADTIPGNHPTFQICGQGFLCKFNTDTIISSAIAIALTLIVIFWVASRVRSDGGPPGKVQMVLELLLSYARGLIKDYVAEDANFILPIAATIFLFILIANWIDFFPLTQPLIPANADVNLTFAMSITVIVAVQWYSVRVLGWRGYFRRYTKPFELGRVARTVYVPLNVIEEVAKPISLALRLFGNIFGGLVMVYLLTLAWSAFVGSSPIQDATSPLWIVALVIWKIFDVFLIGTIQAFIFMLLTIIYFGMAREGLEEEHHAGTGHATELRSEAT